MSIVESPPLTIVQPGGGRTGGLAPGIGVVFKLNGEEELRYDPNPDDAMRQKVLRAAAACPVQAILVEHLTDKAQEVTS